MITTKIKLSTLAFLVFACGANPEINKRQDRASQNSFDLQTNKFQTANLSSSQLSELEDRLRGLYQSQHDENKVSSFIDYVNTLELNPSLKTNPDSAVFYALINSIKFRSFSEFFDNATDILASLYKTSLQDRANSSFSLLDDASESWCVADGNASSEQFGPYEVETTSLERTTIVKPKTIPEGCKLPVVHFANGTGARCSFYAEITEQIASHGFIVSCYQSGSTGSGNGCISGLETVYRNFPDISANLIGSTGHSQGGGASITCNYLAEQKWGDSKRYASSAIQPAHGMGRWGYQGEYAQIKSPVFMMNGSTDILVSGMWVRNGFNALSNEAYWYQANGAGHMRPHNWAKSATLLFFKWKLLGDEKAGEDFLALPESRHWSLKAQK